VLAAATALGACVDEEGVLLDAGLSGPAVAIEATALTTEIEGSFEMHLELGERASDPTTVNIGTFSLERDGRVLVNPLDIVTNPQFPIEVGIGSSKHVAGTIEHSAGEPDLATELCAGSLELVGTLTDTLGDNRPKTLRSRSFQPSCR
jgi:hypothetical protein